MMKKLAKTKAQLELLGWPFIGIQLRDGSKHFGRVSKFTPQTIYFKDKWGEERDVPRQLITRALLLLEGDKTDDRPAAICKTNQA